MKKIFFLSILISFLSCKNTEDKKIEENNVLKTSGTKITTAQKLAVLDTEDETTIDVNDSRVIEIQKHLSSLSKTFNQTEDIIGNSVFILHKKYKEKGLYYSNLEILEDFDKNAEVYKNSGMRFEEFLALVYAMTNK